MAAVSAIRPLTGLDSIPLAIQKQIARHLDVSDRFAYTRLSRGYKVIIEKLNRDEYQHILNYLKSLLETLKIPEADKKYRDLYNLSKLVNQTKLPLSGKQENFHSFLIAYFKIYFHEGSPDCPTRKLLMTNHQFARDAVRWNSSAIAFLPADHPDYETIAKNFVKTTPLALNSIKAKDHPSYPTLALESVRRYRFAIREIPTNHPYYTATLNYATIALEAVKYDGESIQYIPKSHPNYTDTLNYATLALEAVKQIPNAIRHIPTSHPSYTDTLNYSTIAIEALKNYKGALTYIPKDHPSYITILLGAVKEQRELFFKIPKEYFPIDFALEFIKCHPAYFYHFKHLEKDKDYPTLLLEAIKRYGFNIQSIPEEHPHYTTTINYATLALEAVKENGTAIQFIRREHSSYTTTLNYRTIALEAIRQTPQAFECIRKDVPNYAGFVLEMIRRWPKSNIATLIKNVGDMSVIMEAAGSI